MHSIVSEFPTRILAFECELLYKCITTIQVNLNNKISTYPYLLIEINKLISSVAMDSVDTNAIQNMENEFQENKQKIAGIETALAQSIPSQERQKLTNERAILLAHNLELRKGQNLVRQLALGKLIIVLLYVCFY